MMFDLGIVKARPAGDGSFAILIMATGRKVLWDSLDGSLPPLHPASMVRARN